MYKEPFVYGVNLTLAGGTGVDYTDFEVKIDNNVHFELLRFTHHSTSDAINMKIFNSTTGRDFLRSKADLRVISGKAFNGITPNGFIPYNLARPWTLPAGSELLVSAADKSASTNTLHFALHGNHILQGDAPYAQRKERDLWDFQLDMGSIPAYGSVTKTLILDKDAGFLCHKLTAVRTSDCVVYISDQKPWMSRETHIDNMFGNGQFGNALTSPRWTKEGGIITVRISDTSGSANTVKLVFKGEKVYV